MQGCSIKEWDELKSPFFSHYRFAPLWLTLWLPPVSPFPTPHPLSVVNPCWILRAGHLVIRKLLVTAAATWCLIAGLPHMARYRRLNTLEARMVRNMYPWCEHRRRESDMSKTQVTVHNTPSEQYPLNNGQRVSAALTLKQLTFPFSRIHSNTVPFNNLLYSL